MLCDERGPYAVDRKDLGHHRGVELPKALFGTDIGPAMQQPCRDNEQVESTLIRDLTTRFGQRVVIQYIRRQPFHTGIVRRLGPPASCIDAVKSTRYDKLIDKRGADAATASNHQCALTAQMLPFPAMKLLRLSDA